MPKKRITSLAREHRVFAPSSKFSKLARVGSMKEYKKLYKHSVDHRDAFWREQAELIDWYKPFSTVFRYTQKPFFEWYSGGKLNVSYNCLDRHIEDRGDKDALIWQGEGDKEVRKFTYKQLLVEVCRFASVLKNLGVRRGDRIVIYMPMIPELAFAVLACARLGAIHSVVFGGFSPVSLEKRVKDCGAKVVITADGGFRRGKKIHLKKNADEALKKRKHVKKVLVVRRTRQKVTMKRGRDVWLHDELKKKNIADYIEPAVMDAEDPLFILYTSGTTGTPKGMVHTTAGYLVYVTLTTRNVFDLREDDIYWCTADIGWITGHSYIVYGLLSNGATSLMFEGTPDYPHPDRFWEIVEKFKVSIFYTAPTAIRAIERSGTKWVTKHDLSSLRLLGSVGEPINPEAWMWYYKVIGKRKCPIVDTWWQTETGGIMITPLPGATTLRPGSATFPFLGIEPEILTDDGKKVKANEGGHLVIKKPWPGLARTVWKNPKRYIETYFSEFGKTRYVAGDSAKRDKSGYFWILGRLDDVVNVAGHRLGTAEIESALVSHTAVAEAAIVPFPHSIKGQALYAFVTLVKGVAGDDELRKGLLKHVQKEIGPIARPDKIQFTDVLPKTRSGKIMRRILRKIASDEKDIGDTSTLADASVVELLVKNRV